MEGKKEEKTAPLSASSMKIKCIAASRHLYYSKFWPECDDIKMHKRIQCSSKLGIVILSFFFIAPFYMEISPLYEQLLKLSLLPDFPGGSEIAVVGLGLQQWACCAYLTLSWLLVGKMHP